MIDHIGIQVADVEGSLAFYLRTFAPIGIREMMRFPHGNAFVVGLSGPDSIPNFWLSPATGAEARELHLAFRATDRHAVDAVHDAAVTAGAEVLHAPREWPRVPPGLLRRVPARPRRPQRGSRVPRRLNPTWSSRTRAVSGTSQNDPQSE